MAPKSKQTPNNNKAAKPGVQQVSLVAPVPRPVPRVRLSRAGSDFVKCYLNPFSAVPGEGTGIPDGAFERSIVYEYKSSFTVTPDATGSIGFCMVPGLPSSLIMSAGIATCVGIDGKVNTFSATAAGGRTGAVMLPFREWAVQTNNANAILNGAPYPAGVVPDAALNMNRFIRRARPNAWGFSVIPTGSALTMAGQVVSAEIDWSIGVPTTTPLNDVALTPANTPWLGAGSSIVSTLGVQRVVSTNLPYISSYSDLATLPTAVNCPAAKPCVLLGKVGESGRQPLPVSNSFASLDAATSAINSLTDTVLPYGNKPLYYSTFTNPTMASTQLVSAPTTIPAYVANAITGLGPITVCPSGWFWVSHKCPAKLYAATGMPADMPVVIDVRLCIEAEIDEGQSIDRQFVRRAPDVDKTALAMADKAMVGVPPSIPATSEGGGSSVWEALHKLGKGISGVLSGMGIPIVSQVAGFVNALI